MIRIDSGAARGMLHLAASNWTEAEEHGSVSGRAKARRGRPARSVSVKIVRALYAQGYSFRAISQTMGIGYGTVRRAFHGLAPEGADTGTGQKMLPGRTLKAARKVKAAGGR
jgi:hypothetical protein